jgi:hypothetical protein
VPAHGCCSLGLQLVFESAIAIYVPGLEAAADQGEVLGLLEKGLGCTVA